MRKKRQLFKLEIVLIFIVLITLSLIILPFSSSETIPKTHYFLGEKVKINLEELKNYTLKIKTPSDTFLINNNREIYLFSPKEIGKYTLILESETDLRTYSFEVFSEELYSINSTNASIDSIEYSKNLTKNPSKEILEEENSPFLEKRIQKVPQNLKNFQKDEKITLNFSYERKSNVSESKGLKKIFQVLEESVLGNGNKVEIFNYKDEKIVLDYTISDSPEGFNIEISDKNTITPGLYKVKFTLNEANQQTILEDWFIWGVLAMNFDKSEYVENDSSFISLAVLDDLGTIICDASLTLKVTHPNGEITTFATLDNSIILSEECKILGATSLPDYFAILPSLLNGEYHFNLTAETENGIRSISEKIEVKDRLDYDIQRIGPTRTYPKTDYPMQIKIKANKDYNGKVTEKVPSSFTITSKPDLEIKKKSDYKTISWDVDFKEGEEYFLSYEFNTPEISPALFSLGPLELNQFKEKRAWQIANDAEVTIDASILSGTDQFGNSPAVLFINDSLGYSFYIDGSGSLAYSISTDSGTSWGSANAITAQTDIIQFAIWYDKWTPRDTGTLIHLAYSETGGDAYYYRNLNITDNTLRASEVAATIDLGRLNADSEAPTITKNRNGSLFLAGGGNNGGTQGIWKSANNGATWTSINGTFNNDPTMEIQLLPVENGDIIAIYLNSSDNRILSRIFNFSNNTWTRLTNINLSFTEGTSASSRYSWSASLNNNTNYIYLIGNNNPEAAGGDIISYVYNLTTWEQKTNVYTDIGADGRTAKVSLDLVSGDIYSIYLRAPGGTLTSSDLYYKKSSDGMSSWDSENQISSVQDDIVHARPDLFNYDRLYAVWFNDDLNDALGNTVKDIGASDIISSQGKIFSIDTVTSISTTPLGYNQFALAWCEDGINAIYLGIYYTNGSGIYKKIDSSAGSCNPGTSGHSVSVSAFNSSLVAIGWYDSVGDSMNLQVYTSNLSNTTGIVAVDSTAGSSGAVSLDALNSSTLIYSWYDATSSFISFELYNNQGSSVLSRTNVDTTSSDSYSVSVSAFNSTAFLIGWFDSSSNDAKIRSYSSTATTLSNEINVDGNPGESRAVTVSAFNSTTMLFAWYDANSNDNTFRTYSFNGTPISLETDIDADVGNSYSVSSTITNQEEFILSWYDSTTDTGIAGNNLYSNGSLVSAEYSILSNSQLYQDSSSERASTRLQLCDDAIVVAIANTTSNAFWTLLYSNGTIWSGSCSSYIPSIYNLNVSGITITNATINFSTLVKTNATIKYGSTLALLNSKSYEYDYTKKNHSLTLGSLSGSTTYFYNITVCKDSTCNMSGPYNFTTSEADNTSPNVTLLFPTNNSVLTNMFDMHFDFNLSDSSSIQNCTLIMNNASVQLKEYPSLSTNTNLSFEYYLKNGSYIWAVQCTDVFNNIGYSKNFTVNVSLIPHSFDQRLWETYHGDYSTNETAFIKLNNTRDSTQNTVTQVYNPLQLRTIVNASTQFIGANGALIPGGSVVSFSSSFTATSAALRATWKLYIYNSSSSRLICQNGDDSSGGTTINAGTISSTNSTCFSTDTRLYPSDKIVLLLTGYNTAGGTRTITHAWDGTTSSYVDVNISTEGFLFINTTSPTVDPNPSTSVPFSVGCAASCSIGTCRNTRVYVQYNTSTTDWVNISSTGNIILSSGETNPHVLGNITSLTSTTFNLEGSTQSSNNVRCIAISSYDIQNSTVTLPITISAASPAAPSINLTSPVNGTWVNTTNITFFYNLTDINGNPINSTLIINGARNQSNQSALLNGQINNFTISLPDGIFTWTVNASDTTNLIGTDNVSRTIYHDTRQPFVNLTSPNNSARFQSSVIEFNFSITENMASSLTCNLTIDSTIQDSNFQALNGSITNRTISNIAVGNHSWNVSCIDLAGNKNFSRTLNFTILDLPPTVSLQTANNSFFNTTNVSLFYNATDNNAIRSAFIILNGARNQSNTTGILNGQINNITLVNLDEGVYLWGVNVSDTSNFNATNYSQTFTLDRTRPTINLTFPPNNTVTNSSTVILNFTAYDNIDQSLSCNITMGENQDLNFAAANATQITRTLSGFTDGLKKWNVTCIDDSGNRNISVTYNINITEYPRITLNTANNSFFNRSSFNLSYTPTDNTNFSVCNLYLDGSLNLSNSTAILNGQQTNFSVTSISSGVHSWYVSCNDTIGLRNVSQTRIFTTDLNGLSVNSIYPFNASTIFSKTVEFSYNATDDLDNTLSCNISVNGEIIDSYNSVVSGNITNRSIAFTTGGSKLWNVTCQDDSQNTKTSATWNFTLAFAPQINLTSPVNDTWFNSSLVNLFYNASDDNNNLINSTLILNGAINQSNQSVLLNGEINNFTITLQNGRYIWTVNASDTTNLLGTDNISRTFYIDTISPQISVYNPLNTSIISTNNVTFNFTVIDNLDINISCNLTLNQEILVENLNVSNGTYFTYNSIQPDGSYEWNLECQDKATNRNVSQILNFTVEAPPTVTLIQPAENASQNKSTITFTYLPRDAIGIYNCSLIINNQINQTQGSVTNNQNNDFVVTSFPEGRYNWTVQCIDVFPDFNYAQAVSRNITIDYTPPIITLNYPLNNSNTLRNLEFNFTSTDILDNDQNLLCRLNIDASLNRTINSTNGTNTGIYVRGVSLGQHTWNVTCQDDAQNINSSLVWMFNATKADLKVNQSSFIFNNSFPKENETIMLNLTLYNLENVGAGNFSTQIFSGDPDSGGTQLGPNYTISYIGPSGQINLSVNLTAQLGISNIFAIIDPVLSLNGSIEEWNESLNNKANASTTTSSWHYLIGSVSPESLFNLEDNQSYTLNVWTQADFSSGVIYTADSESVINWGSLESIGRNKSDNLKIDDFSEIDNLLSSSNFPDSVYRIYLNSSGNITNTTSWTIFKKTIVNIPIANSTNNSNFMTGILWDGSDDTNGEYDSTDKEDIVFASKINKGALGAYGNYDYELRIPAKLRNYFSANSVSTNLYAEIF